MKNGLSLREHAHHIKRLIMRQLRYERSRISDHRKFSKSPSTQDDKTYPITSPSATVPAPFFVLGHPRSGTTLFRETLNRHPDVFIPPENGSISQMIDAFYNHRNDSWETVVDNVLASFEKGFQIRFWSLDISELSIAARQLPETQRSLNSLFDLIYRQFGLSHAQGKTIWGDKSTPGYFTYLNKLRYVFPKAKYIHLVRDGRDCSVSCVKAGFYSKSHLTAAYAWIDNMFYCRKLRTQVKSDEYMVIRYEDFTNDPVHWTKQVCKFLDLEYDNRMLDTESEITTSVSTDYVRDLSHHENVRKPITPSFVGRWKSQIPSAVISRIQAILRTELLRHSYDPDYPDIS